MSKVYDHFYQMNEHIENSIPVFDLVDELEFSDLTVKGIYFRNMHIDSSDIIDNKHSRNITLMTYQIGQGFSKSILELIENSTAKTKIRIAFCLIKEKNNSKKNIDTLKNLTSAFKDVFTKNGDITIELIANPQTHIKLLQYDNELFIGSMNFSKTADDIVESIEKKHTLNFRNHELLIKFDGGESVTDTIWEKLYTTKGSNRLTINKENYVESLSNAFKDSHRKTIAESKKETEHAEKILRSRREDLQQSVKKELLKIFKFFVSEELALSIDITQEIDILDSSDLRSVYFHMSKVENHDVILNYIVDSSKFLTEEVNCETMESLLDAMSEIIGSRLCEYKSDIDDVVEDILDDRLDQDDGDNDIPFGPISTKRLEDFKRSNDNVIIELIHELIDYFAHELIERNLCKVHSKSIY